VCKQWNFVDLAYITGFLHESRKPKGATATGFAKTKAYYQTLRICACELFERSKVEILRRTNVFRVLEVPETNIKMMSRKMRIYNYGL